MKLPKFTRKDVINMGHRCCKGEGEIYSEEGVKSLFGKKRKATALDVLSHLDIKAVDKIWLIRQRGILPSKKLWEEFAFWCAKRAQDHRKKADAADAAAYAAADAAAYAAAADAAYAAAYAAAAYAAADAAADAAYAAADAAADDAAAYAADADERELQIKKIKELIKKFY